MAALIALTGFAALGGAIAQGTCYPERLTPVDGMALVALSATVSLAAIVAVIQALA